MSALTYPSDRTVLGVPAVPGRGLVSVSGIHVFIYRDEACTIPAVEITTLTGVAIPLARLTVVGTSLPRFIDPLGATTLYARGEGLTGPGDPLKPESGQEHIGLDTEITARIAGDEELAADLETETTSRTDADTALDAAITAEAAARAAADATEAAARAAAVLAEQTAREDADDDLALELATKLDEPSADLLYDQLGDAANAYAAANLYADGIVAAAIATAIPLAQKGALGGVATLDGAGKIPTGQLPALAISDVFTVASQAAMLALDAQRGDVAYRSDTGAFFILTADTPGVLGAWSQLVAPGTVTSVNGHAGPVVALNYADVGAASVNDPRLSDARTPTAHAATHAPGAGDTTSAWYVSKAGGDTITANAVGVVPLTLKGAASQTADLQQWQNNAGGVLAKVDAAGWAGIATSAAPITYLTVGAGTLSPTQPSASYNGIVVRHTTNAAQVSVLGSTMQAGMLIDSGGKAYVGSWSNHPLVLRTNNADAVTIDTGQRMGVGAAPNAAQQFVSVAGAATVVPITAKGVASQSADLTQWLDSAGTTLARVRYDGLVGAPYYDGVGGAGPFLSMSGTQIIAQPRSASQVPFTIKGAASQAANLQEWQNSSGGIQAKMRNDGLLGVPYVTDTADSGPYIGLFSSSAGVANRGSAANVPWYVAGMAGQSGNLTEWRNSSGTVLARVDSAGRGVFGTPDAASLPAAGVLEVFATGSAGFRVRATAVGGSEWFSVGHVGAGVVSFNAEGGYTLTAGAVQRNSARFNIGTLSAASVGLSVQGVASQSANLQEWVDSAGSILGAMSATGVFSFGSTSTAGTFISGATGRAQLVPQSAAIVPLTVKGAASQSSDLSQWVDSGGTFLYSITAAGLPKWAAAGSVQTTVGAAGGASVPPLAPTKYLKVVDNAGTTLVVPAYAAA